jgi:Helix-turn-helix of DDE superfamily endonuclease
MESTKYESLKSLSKSKFRRYTGLHVDNFEMLVLLIQEYESQIKLKDGRPCNLCVEDRILMFLEYYRENRTFFHLSVSYGLHESNVYKTIIKIEDIIIQSGYFRLAGKKVLLTDKEVKHIIVDVTETPAQRPKKKT